MKKVLNLLLILFYISTWAQENQTVTLTTTGTGKTLEEATSNALRSAIEQTFGTFISSRTEIFNDQLVADQIASVSNGNIKSFEILNQDQLPDGRWGVTLKAIVSLDKLTSFVQAKGIAIELKGGLFALNIKQQILNEEGEIKAISEVVGLLHEALQNSFDYVINSSDPKSLDAENKNWEIPLVVTATCNKNMDFCARYLKKSLEAISLSPTEVETYNSLNKQIHPITVTYQNQSVTYNLRRQTSLDAIKSLASNWEFYTRLFTVQSGMDESYGNGEGKVHLFSKFNLQAELNIIFPSSESVAGTFSWNDKRTLNQIEKMTGYSVKPRGVVSNFKHGGFVVQNPLEGRFMIGIQISTLSNEVSYLVPKYPAENSGLKLGDKVISINGADYIDINTINDAVKDGKQIDIRIERNGVIGNFKVIPTYFPGRKGLVVALFDFGEYFNWNEAKIACDELVLNGYSDWRLPSIEELKILYNNFFMRRISGAPIVFDNRYWSNTLNPPYHAWYFNIRYGEAQTNLLKEAGRVRAVREF